MKLNDVKGPCLIMAGSGMCNAGRILHHLKHSLSDENTAVMIVGYQAEGSLGRQLVEVVVVTEEVSGFGPGDRSDLIAVRYERLTRGVTMPPHDALIAPALTEVGGG